MSIKKITLLILGVVFVLFFALLYIFRSQVSLASKFLFPDTSQIKSDKGRANFLVLGIGGKDHTGGDLTDTIMLVSINLEGPGVDIVSVPRDLWIPEIRAKINSAYHYGGTDLAKAAVEKVTGIKIQYSAIVDFSAFKDMVDALGGILVNVETGFSDKLYPIAERENDTCDGDRAFACRYETVTFVSGLQLMNGDTALKFVRSRHAEGSEGTDQAREARQQKIIDAIKNKLLSPQIYLSMRTDKAIFKVLRVSIETNVDDKTAATVARKVFDSRNSINKYLIPDGFLVNPPITNNYDNQYVLIPKEGNGKWGEIQKWVSELFK
ncbi:MAG: Cell envelope-related transcriptional attenuator [Microgenomates group bacterium GW2011_GWC1_39_7b]|uniref:Cell envelope-related transcriptional attenuator n=3 Tax=Candidatus Woeseibacteriota TaxID=1752722 RepID=A0A0G0LVV6_9BACT|nr:MAG: Cell envelope-related transcriptional attenuator [Candidatus Woesebacteria bacterium GW2011_GWB1_39_10]KKR26504.1 MAG: Cell envelope-related transcriptional attenuator [Microgenomates group bacterium GW2011_GWC1_39_7b]KKR74312.1 MAG: Cell envelope-related transcriptional attenuator [Candidatus Woesebacteria bacterium GW2011_GWA2_40_7]KKS91085.1 MAG: Cell envelope-related transcriptional attenuator [Candidatus Woesebacteria bacterium GW2011_GWA1_43_12]